MVRAKVAHFLGWKPLVVAMVVVIIATMTVVIVIVVIVVVLDNYVADEIMV